MKGGFKFILLEDLEFLFNQTPIIICHMKNAKSKILNLALNPNMISFLHTSSATCYDCSLIFCHEEDYITWISPRYTFSANVSKKLVCSYSIQALLLLGNQALEVWAIRPSSSLHSNLCLSIIVRLSHYIKIILLGVCPLVLWAT